MGLSAAGALPADLLKTMAPKPIVFAMANPDPEISPPDAKRVRPDVNIATGRSAYPKQVNNVLGFPLSFPGDLEVPAQGITDAMKIDDDEGLAAPARPPGPEAHG